MPSFWERLLERFTPPKPLPLGKPRPSSTATPARATPKVREYPNTYQSVARNRVQAERAQVFEPALKHFQRAFRLGDPVFHDEETRSAWYDTRLQVVNHLLLQISGSVWKDHLVLRGSLLLKAWLGDAAREPGDIDWVFRPKNVTLTHPQAKELFADLVRMVTANPRAGNAQIQVDKISIDDIWTYERAAGRRIVFPWKAEGLPPGHVQMDVVFGEELFVEPVRASIPLPYGDSVVVWAATKEVSLAWKLLWLETDSYPQGKDLYDATLLAEQTPLPFDLLRQVLASASNGYHDNLLRPAAPLEPDFPMKWYVDWDNFKREYPWVEGEATDWQARLQTALMPTFSA